MADAGQLTPRVHAELPLDRWRDAFAMMARREVVGRVVIAP
jgi:NADPH2:quinone reductase